MEGLGYRFCSFDETGSSNARPTWNEKGLVTSEKIAEKVFHVHRPPTVAYKADTCPPVFLTTVNQAGAECVFVSFSSICFIKKQFLTLKKAENIPPEKPVTWEQPKTQFVVEGHTKSWRTKLPLPDVRIQEAPYTKSTQ